MLVQRRRQGRPAPRLRALLSRLARLQPQGLGRGHQLSEPRHARRRAAPQCVDVADLRLSQPRAGPTGQRATPTTSPPCAPASRSSSSSNDDHERAPRADAHPRQTVPRAATVLEQLAAKPNADGTTLYLLGFAYSRAKNFPKAAAALERAAIKRPATLKSFASRATSTKPTSSTPKLSPPTSAACRLRPTTPTSKKQRRAFARSPSKSTVQSRKTEAQAANSIGDSTPPNFRLWTLTFFAVASPL